MYGLKVGMGAGWTRALESAGVVVVEGREAVIDAGVEVGKRCP